MRLISVKTYRVNYGPICDCRILSQWGLFQCLKGEIMEENKREFKGVWIPKEIWLNNELSLFEKCLFAEIDSLDGEYGCYASNEYFAKFFNVSESSVTRGISTLLSLGLIYKKFDGRTRTLRVVKLSMEGSQIDESASAKNEFLLYKENKKENKKEKAPEPVPSEIKSSKRNFRRETEPLKDVLESGADIKKQVDSQKKKKTTKEKCLDEIEETKYGFTDDEKEVLREYLEWAVSGRDNRRIKNVDLWRNKLNTLIQLRDDGEDITKVVQNSLEKKWYVFVEEKQNHSNSSSHYVQKVDRIVNTKSNFNSKEEVEAELKRRVEVGIPSFK